jgi:hypothetical protein
MVESKEFLKEYEERMREESKPRPGESWEAFCIRGMDQCIEQNLATSNIIHKYCADTTAKLGKQCVVWAVKEDFGEKQTCMRIVPIDALPDFLIESMPMLREDLRTMNPETHGCFILTLSNPLQNDMQFNRYIIYSKNICDILPSRPVKYVPTISYNKPHAPINRRCSLRDCEENKAKHRCSVCKRVRYCSRACQKKDWKTHKKVCSPYVEDNMFDVKFVNN